MIHCFSVRGQRLVLDVNSQMLHTVDDLAWAVLAGGFVQRRQAVRALESAYAPADIRETFAEIEDLRSRGLLFAPDPHGGYEPPAPRVKALCLNVAHGCNLACDYCFAAANRPGVSTALMPARIARRAVDFLLRESGARRHVEIDFFGGEPLLNFPVVRETVAYARDRAAAASKQVGFTLTTNALLVSPDVTEFLLTEGINTVLSLDGRRIVHDRFRRTVGGRGTQRDVLARAAEFKTAWSSYQGQKGYYYIRGTYTRHNLDFTEDFRYLVDLGFEKVSLEPVVAAPETGFALTDGDLPRLKAEYARLADAYLELRQQKPGVRFFHFEVDLDEGPCLPKRLSGCGAGHAYLAVDAAGRLFPCHQFLGHDRFVLGDVFDGLGRWEVVDHFRRAHVYAKEDCGDCWAKFLCSGGCHAHAFMEHGDILKPHRMGCAIMRARLECALYVQAVRNGVRR